MWARSSGPMDSYPSMRTRRGRLGRGLLLPSWAIGAVQARGCCCVLWALFVARLEEDHDATPDENTEDQSNVGECCNGHVDLAVVRKDDGGTLRGRGTKCRNERRVDCD